MPPDHDHADPPDDLEPPDPPPPRWEPERVSVTSADVPRDRVAAAAPDGGVSPLLLGSASQLQQVVASILVRRTLVARGVDVISRMHRSGVMFLECRGEAATTLGFVVASASSMQPRPIWPTLIPLRVLDVAPVDWIASCSVPKQPALDAVEERPGDAYVLGWLTADDIAELPVVTIEPHLGHEFEAKYRQVKHHQLRSFSDWR